MHNFKLDYLFQKEIIGWVHTKIRLFTSFFLYTQAKYVRYPRSQCVSPSWDNTARRRERGGRVCLDALPEIVEKFYLTNAKEGIVNKLLGDGMLFVNTWNEWAKSVHLESDERNGYSWLCVVQNSKNFLLSAL